MLDEALGTWPRRRFAAGTELEGVADVPGGCRAVRGTSTTWRSEPTGASWSSANKGKCQVLYLGRNNPPPTPVQVGLGLEGSFAEKPLGSWCTWSQPWASNGALQQESSAVFKAPLQGGLGGFCHVYKYLVEVGEEGRSKLFTVVCSDRTRSDSHKQKFKTFHLKIRKPTLLWGWASTGIGCCRGGCRVCIFGDAQSLVWS